MMWPEPPLSQVLSEAKTGTWGLPPNDDGSNYPVLRSTNIHDAKLVLENIAFRSLPEITATRYKLIDGDIIVTTSSGSKHLIGKNAIFHQPNNGLCYLFSNFTLRCRPKKELILPRYLHHYLNSSRAKAELLRIQSTTSGLRNLNVSLYLLQPVSLPPLSEQKRIVEILDQADNLRMKSTEAEAKASRILPALFHKIFGDPITNPKGWPTKKLGDLYHVVGGGTPSKSSPEYWAGDIPWVSPKDMKCDVVLDTEDHITPEAINNSSTRIVKEGSVLIVYRSGILVHSFPVAIAGRDLTINQDLKALSSKGEVTNEYLYGLLTAVPAFGLSCVKKGATVHNVDGHRFMSLKICMPPEQLQKVFASQLHALLKNKTERQETSLKIERLFALLLHRAFKGDLTAKWSESHMNELLKEMEIQAKYLEEVS